MLALIAALYRALVRPILFLLDAERAHAVASLFLGLLHRSRVLRALFGRGPALPVSALGLRFPSPVGVAAGFDKAGTMYDGLGALGFGFVEVGTVTALAQPGNPRPRLFRLRADRALVNRMGFNNPGAEAVAARLARHRRRGPHPIVLGVNIGKSRVTPLAEAPADYATSARLLLPHADYLVVNVSSPNTPGLRALQALEPLRAVLLAVLAERDALPRRVPVLVKIAPDLGDEELDAVADLARALDLDGVVATNTTIARAGLESPKAAIDAAGEGGLSGAPLRARTIEIVRRLRERLGPDATIIAAGGLATAADASEALRAGANLVQVYTALVYEGPAIARAIVRGLRRDALVL